MSALALVVTGCGDKTSTTPDEKEPDSYVNHFTITVDDVTAGTCVLNVVRDDPDQGFYYAVVQRNDFDYLGDDIQSRAKAYLRGEVDWWISDWGYTEEEAIEATIYSEDIVDYPIEYLYGATDYIVIAAYLDENAEAVGDFEYVKFSSATPDPSDNTFKINIDGVTARSVTYTVTPSIADEDYAAVIVDYETYKNVPDADLPHKLIHEVFGYFINYASGEHTFKAGSDGTIYAGKEYEICIFGLDSSHSVATTPLYKQVFKTNEPGDPSKLTMDVEYSSGAVNGYTMKAKLTPSDDSIDYFVELVDDSWTVEEFTKVYKADIDSTAASWGVDVATYMGFFAQHGDYETSSVVYPGMKYKFAVLPVYADKGEFAGDAFFTSTYEVPASVEGKATINVTFDKYYDGTAIAEIDEMWSYLSGSCVFPVTVDYTGVSCYYYLYKVDGKTYSRDDIIATLVNGGSSWDMDCFMPFDTDGVIYGVSIDEDGNPGPIFEKKVRFSKDGVSPAQEFLADKKYLSQKEQKEQKEQKSAPAHSRKSYATVNSPVAF